jgi:hypothetical protein
MVHRALDDDAFHAGADHLRLVNICPNRRFRDQPGSAHWPLTVGEGEQWAEADPNLVGRRSSKSR